MLFPIELRCRNIKTLHHMQQHNTKKANIRITDVRKALLPQFTKGAQTRAGSDSSTRLPSSLRGSLCYISLM